MTFNPLDKPEYLLRPQQILRRLAGPRMAEGGTFAEATLPWGLPIRFRPHEMLGSSIWRTGLYELCVSEAIWRLLEPGEVALDIGANIGYMTSVMAARVGPAGRVMAYEPHPEVFTELAANAERWGPPSAGRITVFQAAVSEEAGTATLSVPDDFEHNRGLSSLGDVPGAPGTNSRSYAVETVRLADQVNDGESVGLMKIDVEGHELSVLKGGEILLSRKRIRDVIFEEHRPYPTPVTALLEAHGYTLFRFARGRFGLEFCPVQERLAGERRSHDAQSFLATADADRALVRLHRKGWAVLGGRPR